MHKVRWCGQKPLTPDVPIGLSTGLARLPHQLDSFWEVRKISVVLDALEVAGSLGRITRYRSMWPFVSRVDRRPSGSNPHIRSVAILRQSWIIGSALFSRNRVAKRSAAISSHAFTRAIFLFVFNNITKSANLLFDNLMLRSD